MSEDEYYSRPNAQPIDVLEDLPLEVMRNILEKVACFSIKPIYKREKLPSEVRLIIAHLMSVNKVWLYLMRKLKSRSTLKLVLGVFSKTKNIKIIGQYLCDNWYRNVGKYKDFQCLNEVFGPNLHGYFAMQIEYILQDYTIEYSKSKNTTSLSKSDNSNDEMRRKVIGEIGIRLKKVMEEYATNAKEEHEQEIAKLQMSLVTLKQKNNYEISNFEKSIETLKGENEILKDQLKNCESETSRQKKVIVKLSEENGRLLSENTRLRRENELLMREIDVCKQKSYSIEGEAERQQQMNSESTHLKSAKDTTGDADSDISGYPKAIFAEEIDEKYLCIECKLILKNPIQSFCGHRFCKDCFDHLLSLGSGKAVCCGCREENGEDSENILEESKTFPDNAIRRELYQMVALCSFGNCNWSGTFRQYEDHYSQCEWFPVKCHSCGERTPKNQFDRHQCLNAVGQLCKFQCGKPVLEGDFSQHIRKFIPEHIEAMFVRLANVISLIGNDVRHHRIPLKDQLKALEEKVNSLDGKLPTLGNSANQQRNSNPGENSGNVEIGTTGTLYANDFARTSGSESLKLCESILALLNREVEQTSNQMSELENSSKTQKRKWEEDVEKKLKSIDRVLAVKEVAAAEFAKRLTDLEQASYDGSFLWRITDFQKKRQDAISGRATSFYSPAFYTSKTGYKMCARLYLNGDGMGKGTHVSLFFVVMRGQYDALLKWPFRQKVTLMFLDQNGRQHIIDAFRPDSASSSFRRPTTEMNIASGCPLFMPLTQLNSLTAAYVREDTAFIKIIVSLEDI